MSGDDIMKGNDFSHLDHEGNVRMVDVSHKQPTMRTAKAQAKVFVSLETFEKIENRTLKKGNVLETARIAGVMAAKKTAELIPMCHPMNITHAQVDFIPDKTENAITVIATVRIFHQTGVEMEALTAVSVAALTIYDMCKSVDKRMMITDICLLEKTGGKSGSFVR